MKRVSPYLKMRVLSAIDFAPGRTIRARIIATSEQTFVDDGTAFQFTWRTIQTWYSNFQKHGVTSTAPLQRSDRGRIRKLTPERLADAVAQARVGFRGKPPVAALYRACIEQQLFTRHEMAPNTFHRVVKQLQLLDAVSDDATKPRLAFAKAHANDMWQADTMVGPYVTTPRGKVQAKLIAFLDDASRVCCHGEFVLAESTQTLGAAFRQALYKRGVPASVYVDNGSIYASKELSQICTRLGTLLLHAPVRDGAAKGKVERFFRTVREQFLTRQLDLASLANLNTAFIRWLEDEYHLARHATLQMRPIDRFGLDLARIRYLPPNDVNDELFFFEQTRTVLADNTFSLRRTRFEAPRDVRHKQIVVRFDRHDPTPVPRVIVYYQGERLGPARSVDFVANDRRPVAAAAPVPPSARQPLDDQAAP